jgi:hypothetical protein
MSEILKTAFGMRLEARLKHMSGANIFKDGRILTDDDPRSA